MEMNNMKLQPQYIQSFVYSKDDMENAIKELYDIDDFSFEIKYYEDSEHELSLNKDALKLFSKLHKQTGRTYDEMAGGYHILIQKLINEITGLNVNLELEDINYFLIDDCRSVLIVK